MFKTEKVKQWEKEGISKKKIENAPRKIENVARERKILF